MSISRTPLRSPVSYGKGATEGRNVKIAADFIRSMGQDAIADNILEWLRKGKIYYDTTLKENGDTGGVSKDITISSQIVRNQFAIRLAFL